MLWKIPKPKRSADMCGFHQLHLSKYTNTNVKNTKCNNRGSFSWLSATTYTEQIHMQK
jgi:hypothetical protein